MRVHRRRRGCRGQALYELACILPLMLAIFAGGFSLTESITDDQLVNVAVGQSARYAAQVGNDTYPAAATNCQSSSTDPCQADKLIIGTLLPLIQQLISVSVQEIDIYEPTTCSPPTSALAAGTCPADVGYQTADPVDRYNGSGTALANTAAGQYTLDKRIQASPNETSIGVSVKYTYSPPTHVFTLTLTQYSAYRLEPQT
jgi:hypothetical protein